MTKKIRIHLYDGTQKVLNVGADCVDNDPELIDENCERQFGNNFDYWEVYHETNIEMITRVFNFSKNGTLAQAFALQAIDQFAKAVIDAGLPEDDGGMHFISPQAWLACAEEWKAEIKNQYE